MADRKAQRLDFTAFSEGTRASLRKAGWSPRRHFDVSTIEACYAEEGIPLWPAARLFLSSFGDLVIEYKTASGGEDALDFVAREAVQGEGRGALRAYESAVNEGSLCPIGYYSMGTYMVMMTQHGKVYAASNWTILLIGSSGVEAIENVIAGKHLKLIGFNSRRELGISSSFPDGPLAS
jgi:SUKH-3 immunity protein